MMEDIKCFFCGSKTINTLLENTHGLGSIYTVCENEKCGACVPVTKWEEHKSELDRLKQNQAKLIEALNLFTEYKEIYGEKPFYPIPHVKIKIACEIMKEVCGEEKIG
jgi:hypothetical protein